MDFVDPPDEVWVVAGLDGGRERSRLFFDSEAEVRSFLNRNFLAKARGESHVEVRAVWRLSPDPGGWDLWDWVEPAPIFRPHEEGAS